MNMMKKTGGFTLVELIVVIAILAILAAVAVPAYSGYIQKAQEATVYTQLDSVKTAIVFKVAEETLGAGVVETAEVTFNKLTEVSVTGTGFGNDNAGAAITTLEVDITDYVTAIDAGDTGYTKATLADGKWTLEK